MLLRPAWFNQFVAVFQGRPERELSHSMTLLTPGEPIRRVEGLARSASEGGKNVLVARFQARRSGGASRSPAEPRVEITLTRDHFQKALHARIIKAGHALPFALDPIQIQRTRLSSHQVFDVENVLSAKGQQLQEDKPLG